MTTTQTITPVELAGSYKTGSLPASLTEHDIERVLGFAPNIEDDYSKVQFSWGFEVDGKRCGIWDYHGDRWSVFDPENVLPSLFAKTIAKATGKDAESHTSTNRRNNMAPAPEGYAYGFVQFSRAWYAQACNLPDGIEDEVMVGLYADQGGCRWEFAIRWIRLSTKLEPRVEIFSDAWQAFTEIPSLFAELATRNSLTPIECCRLLENTGFADLTRTKRAA